MRYVMPESQDKMRYAMPESQDKMRYVMPESQDKMRYVMPESLYVTRSLRKGSGAKSRDSGVRCRIDLDAELV